MLLVVVLVAAVVMVVLLVAVMDLHHNIREVLSQLESLEVFAVLQVAAGHGIYLSIGVGVAATTASRRCRKNSAEGRSRRKRKKRKKRKRKKRRKRRRKKRRRTVYCKTAAVCSSGRLRKATKKGIKPSGCR